MISTPPIYQTPAEPDHGLPLAAFGVEGWTRELFCADGRHETDGMRALYWQPCPELEHPAGIEFRVLSWDGSSGKHTIPFDDPLCTMHAVFYGYSSNCLGDGVKHSWWAVDGFNPAVMAKVMARLAELVAAHAMPER